jgi:hypothetical protein
MVETMLSSIGECNRSFAAYLQAFRLRNAQDGRQEPVYTL